MNLLIVLLIPFGLAAAAPGVCHLTNRLTGWLLAAPVAALTVLVAAWGPDVWREGPRLSHLPWAPSIGLSLSFRLDGLSWLFALLITGIGALVTVYAGAYLGAHPRLGRFYASLLFFLASMLGLVLADNLLLLFVFWELTSISSYLLIGFDQEREAARRAALQALLVTAGGGLALLAGFVLLGQIGGSFELSALFPQAATVRGHSFYGPILGLILLGAFTKSAQFPFHFWLPAAMEAPTPVSAYLHAATMVKAGVYLLARLSPLLADTQAWFWSLTPAGAITMLVGAITALCKTDLKQILAYSTVSVLGILTFLAGLGTVTALEALAVYLLAHSLYKGALFLVAGAIDHETGTRDTSQLGGLRHSMPLTAAAGLIAALSMAGLPPVLGFISKETLYEAGLRAPQHAVVLTKLLVVTAVALFAVAGAAGVRPFFGPPQAPGRQPHEAPVGLWLGPVILAFGGLLFGLIPGRLEQAVETAVRAVAPDRSVQVRLSLYHGLNPALMLSALSVAAGFFLYRLHARYPGPIEPWPALARLAPARAYESALLALNRLASWQTQRLQSGYLRSYLLIIVTAALGLSAVPMVMHRVVLPLSLDLNPRWHELLLGTVILAGIVTAVRTTSRLTAVASLGVVGLGIALLFAWLGAPDLAMTQLAVETLTVILLVLVLYHLPDFSRLTPARGRRRDATVALAAGGFMALLVLIVNSTESDSRLAAYFLEQARPLGRGCNVVNVILTDFRALDTLGEITVLAVAAVGVYGLIRLRLHGGRRA
ncbi:MAG: putative monovalent cation/H+ antiporter subunit A [Bryobacteraceae bacterium]|nr:putative monovalent cation/H+ antiporter subunit A [Bryobacteraceae bacterium]